MLRRFVRAPVHLDRRGHDVQAARVLPLVVAVHDHLQEGWDVHLMDGRVKKKAVDRQKAGGREGGREGAREGDRRKGSTRDNILRQYGV